MLRDFKVKPVPLPESSRGIKLTGPARRLAGKAEESWTCSWLACVHHQGLATHNNLQAGWFQPLSGEHGET